MEYRQQLDDNPAMTHADLAELEGVSRSKVSQILPLSRLPAAVQHAVLRGDEEVAGLGEVRQLLPKKADAGRQAVAAVRERRRQP